MIVSAWMVGGDRIRRLFYSGVLTKEQVDTIYENGTTSNNTKYGTHKALMTLGTLHPPSLPFPHTHSTTFLPHHTHRYGTRPMTLGCCGYNNKQVTFWAYGIPYGLLQHDMIERFLLHYFAMSAHTYTRGTWTAVHPAAKRHTTPSPSPLHPDAVATHPDRDVGGTDYVAAGVMTSPTYLKWMLLYEEPDSRTIWLAKALPRDWLAPGTPQPVLVDKATTRYGRVSYRLHARVDTQTKAYTVYANVTLPMSYATKSGGPRGGVRLRLRAPLPHAGKLKAVTIGGKSWRALMRTPRRSM